MIDIFIANTLFVDYIIFAKIINSVLLVLSKKTIFMK